MLLPCATEGKGYLLIFLSVVEDKDKHKGKVFKRQQVHSNVVSVI